MVKRALFGLTVAALQAVLLQGQDCTLTVPADPLNTGLGKPWILGTLAGSATPCSQLDPGTAVFVEATIIDPTTGKVSVYSPLVVDNVNQIASPIVPAKLTANSIVGIWFGANGATLTLLPTIAGNANSLTVGNCVNGIQGSIFGQFAYCNAPALFNAADLAIQSGLLVVPNLGKTYKGKPCPTTRSFSVVDQDQSDNVVSDYILTTDQKLAQNTVANRANLTVLMKVGNGSDNRLLDKFLAVAGFCSPMTAPDNIDPGVMRSSLALNEISAKTATIANTLGSPPALVPAGDPMALDNNGNQNLAKLNAYRAGVNQPPVASLAAADTTAYCNNLANLAPQNFALNAIPFSIMPPPDPAVGNNLLNFLAARFNATWINLGCDVLTKKPSPLIVTMNAEGVATGSNLVKSFGAFIPTADTNTQVPDETATTDSTSVVSVPAATIGLAVGVVAVAAIGGMYVVHVVTKRRYQNYDMNVVGQVYPSKV